MMSSLVIKPCIICVVWAQGLCLSWWFWTCCQYFSAHLTCLCYVWKQLSKNSSPSPPIHLCSVLKHVMRFLFRKERALGFRKELTVCLHSRSFISLWFCLGLRKAVSLWTSRPSFVRSDHLQRSFSWAQSLHSHEKRHIWRLFMCIASFFTSK